MHVKEAKFSHIKQLHKTHKSIYNENIVKIYKFLYTQAEDYHSFAQQKHFHRSAQKYIPNMNTPEKAKRQN